MSKHPSFDAEFEAHMTQSLEQIHTQLELLADNPENISALNVLYRICHSCVSDANAMGHDTLEEVLRTLESQSKACVEHEQISTEEHAAIVENISRVQDCVTNL